MLCIKMYRPRECKYRTICIICLCMIFFSTSHGRPKESDAVTDMAVGGPESKQDVIPSFQIRRDTEEKTEDRGADTKESGENPTKPPVFNVHDVRARAMADYMKQMPVKAGDTEEIMHGGHHVHGEEHERSKETIGVGGAGMDELMGGQKEKEEDKGDPTTFDTEQLMHAGEGEGHGHNPHTGEHKEVHGPTAENPEDLLHMRDLEFQAEQRDKRDPGAVNPEETVHAIDIAVHQKKPDIRKEDSGKDTGISIEGVIHGDGEDHDHDKGVTEEYVDEDGVTRTRKLGKQITMEDIEKLGLSKKDLEGIDLSKLLRRDQSEYETWKKDQKEYKDKGFWEKVDDFRKNYFDMLSKQIRDMSRFDDDKDPEWEIDADDDEPHPGESRVEHESEMWGSTNPKKNRRRKSFTVIHRQTHDGTEEL